MTDPTVFAIKPFVMKTKYYFSLVLSCVLQASYAQSCHAVGPGLKGAVDEIVIDGDDVYVC